MTWSSSAQPPGGTWQGEPDQEDRASEENVTLEIKHFAKFVTWLESGASGSQPRSFQCAGILPPRDCPVVLGADRGECGQEGPGASRGAAFLLNTVKNTLSFLGALMGNAPPDPCRHHLLSHITEEACG